jgi:hypothetical protein
MKSNNAGQRQEKEQLWKGKRWYSRFILLSIAKTKGKEQAKALSKAKTRDEFEEIDTILKDLDAKQAAQFVVTQTSDSEPPSPRSNGQLWSHGNTIYLYKSVCI